MNILVTGAMGFIGSNLCIKLLNEGHSVIAFDNLFNSSEDAPTRIKNSVGSNWKNFKFYKVDIRQTDMLLTISRTEDVGAVVHLAALGSVPRSFLNPIEVIDVNQKGFMSVMQVASQLGVKRMVYASSSSVYGDSKNIVRSEGDTPLPKSPYALSKLHNEQLAFVWGAPAGMEMIGLRFFNVYGPGQRADSQYAAVIPKFLNQDMPTIYGDGRTSRDFTYVNDVCDAIGLAIESKSHSTIINVGTGVGTSLNELVSIMGKKPEHSKERFGDVKASIASCTKARAVLGFEAKTTLSEGIRKTSEYLKSLKK
jgi:nucleoside-diphosphate-sugar epimerase